MMVFLKTITLLAAAVIVSGGVIHNTKNGLTFLGSFNGKEYYGGASKTTYQNAWHACRDADMTYVIFDSPEEVGFLVNEGILENHGPFWLGARDLGRPEMYRWSAAPPTAPPAPDAEAIDPAFNFYHSVEDGPMALTLNAAYGTFLVGVHSHKVAAKPFCQPEG